MGYSRPNPFLLSVLFAMTCFPGSSASTSPSATVVRLLQKHWELFNIVFMVAKQGNICFGNKFVSGEQKCFWLEAKTLVLLPSSNICHRHMFSTWLIWETFGSVFNNVDNEHNSRLCEYLCFCKSFKLKLAQFAWKERQNIMGNYFCITLSLINKV